VTIADWPLQSDAPLRGMLSCTIDCNDVLVNVMGHGGLLLHGLVLIDDHAAGSSYCPIDPGFAVRFACPGIPARNRAPGSSCSPALAGETAR